MSTTCNRCPHCKKTNPPQDGTVSHLQKLINHQVEYLKGNKEFDINGENSGCCQILSLAEKKIIHKIIKINELGLLTYSGQSGQCVDNLTYEPEIEVYAYDILDRYQIQDGTIPKDYDEKTSDLSNCEEEVGKMLSHMTQVSVYEKYYLVGICETPLAQKIESVMSGDYVECTVIPAEKFLKTCTNIGNTSCKIFRFDNHSMIVYDGCMSFGGSIRKTIKKAIKLDTNKKYSFICIFSHLYGVDLSDRVISAISEGGEATIPI